ncbi:Formin-like protein [Melia azedarach]|uniref:Formin-like protein n=1 Tax=Melia azedarach TaxID=155640 RepID=A0ACC1XYA8_MELAZ|nr:Formin-like protein [Melia azedarach]
MSALIDIWTSEVDKLRQKGSTISPSGSTHVDVEANTTDNKQEIKSFLLAGKVSAFLQEMKVHSLAFPYSEASVSMLLDCFSP